jgi:chromosome segregation ATPase
MSERTGKLGIEVEVEAREARGELEKVGKAVGDVGQSAKGATDGMEGLASGGREAGEAAASLSGSLADTNAAAEATSAGLEGAAAGAEAAGGSISAFSAEIDAAVAAIEAEIDAVMRSDASLQHKQATLLGIKDGLHDVAAATDEHGVRSEAAAEAAAQALRSVRGALAEVEVQSEETFAPIERHLQNAETAVAAFEAKVASGARITSADLARITQAQELLKMEIEDSGKSFEDLSETAQARYAEVEESAEKATVTLRRVTSAVKDNKDALSPAGVQWRGFGNAVGQVNPKLQATIGLMGGVTAAFSAGWAAGMKINRFFGTDMSEWDAMVQQFAIRGKAVLLGLSSQVWSTVQAAVAAVSFLKSAVFLDFDAMRNKSGELKRSLLEMVDEWVAAGDRYVAAFTAPKEEVEKLVGAIKHLTPEMALAAEAAKNLASENAALAASLEDLNEKYAATTEEAEQLATEYEILDGRVRGITEVIRIQEGVLGASEEAHRAAAEEVKRLTAERGVNDVFTKQAIENERALAFRLEETKKRLDREREALELSTVARDDMGTKLDATNGKLNQLAIEAAKVRDRQAELAAGATAVASAAVAAKRPLEDLTTATEGLATATRSTVEPSETLAKNLGEVGVRADESIRQLTGLDAASIAEKFDTIAESVARLATELEDLDTRMKTAKDSAERLTGALAGVQSAAAAAAGDEAA